MMKVKVNNFDILLNSKNTYLLSHFLYSSKMSSASVHTLYMSLALNEYSFLTMKLGIINWKSQAGFCGPPPVGDCENIIIPSLGSENKYAKTILSILPY